MTHGTRLRILSRLSTTAASIAVLAFVTAQGALAGGLFGMEERR